MERFDLADRYESAVDGWVHRALLQSPQTFGDFLRMLPAVYPTVAVDSLNRIARTEPGFRQTAAMLSADAGGSRSKAAVSGSALLPLPHPLDFEWRFTMVAARLLLDAAAALTRSGGTLLLIGTPGVALEAMNWQGRNKVVFVGERNLVMRRLAELNLSAMSPLSILECPDAPTGMHAGAVILDPPWYSDYFTPMIAAAAVRCQFQGHVLVSLPPHGVRPTAPEDREAVLRTASRCGLELVVEYPLALDYETPFFEANALAASGLVAPLQWRRGDLAIFRKTRQGTLTGRLRHRPKSWHEAEIRGMRLRILRKQGTASHPGTLIPLLKGDILPTVSRRDPRRRQATVWTSGNRIFATSNPSLLIAAAGLHSIVKNRAYRSQTLSSTMKKGDDLWRVNYAFNELACQEAQEEATWRTPKGFDRGQNCTSKLTNYRSG